MLGTAEHRTYITKTHQEPRPPSILQLRKILLPLCVSRPSPSPVAGINNTPAWSGLSATPRVLRLCACFFGFHLPEM